MCKYVVVQTLSVYCMLVSRVLGSGVCVYDVWVQMCLYVRVYMCVCAYKCVCVYVCTYVYMCVYMCMCYVCLLYHLLNRGLHRCDKEDG